MNALITGGAGFIASHLAKSLLDNGNKVVCIDNFELGRLENIKDLLERDQFSFFEQDVNNIDALCQIVRSNDIDIIYHLAANSDIQKSAKNPNIDFKNTLSTTIAVLEAMRICGVKNLFFASTSAVYGEKTNETLTEKTGELSPISYYGAAKLSSEAYISAYSYMNDLNTLVFRFPNVIGPNLTHGVIFDFIKKLEKNPNELEILGDGTQSKPYIYAMDLIDGIMMLSQKIEKGMNIYNIGVETSTSVTKIADILCEKLGLISVEYKYTGGSVGWKGDVPRFQYSMEKIYNRNWKPKYSSDEAVAETIEFILETMKETKK